MKTMKYYGLALIFIGTLAFNSCEDLEQFEPLGENSIADATPPSASFTYTQGAGTEDAWKEYTFANASTSATMYMWDFGNGESSTEVDGFTIYPGEGTYTVTLTVSDNNGVESTFTETIEVIEPEEPAAIIPVINESSFEDNSPGSEDCGDGNMDGRDCWRNSDLGGVIQITSSPVQNGSQASKYPSAGDRIAYQELTVSPNTDYIITYYYTLKTNNPGSITLHILAGGGYVDYNDAIAGSIASFEGTDQTSANDYVQVNLPFNTGANDMVSIFITNQGEEARLDNISIDSLE